MQHANGDSQINKRILTFSRASRYGIQPRDMMRKRCPSPEPQPQPVTYPPFPEARPHPAKVPKKQSPDDMPPLYKLKSDDGQIFMVERQPMKASALINQWFIDHGVNDRNCHRMEAMPVPFASPIVAMIIRWLYHHQDDRPRDGKLAYRDFSAWDKEFLNVDPAVLFAMLNASHHLGIEELMNMGCATAAELIRGKSTEEIREIYGIRSDEEQVEDMIANGEPGPSGMSSICEHKRR